MKNLNFYRNNNKLLVKIENYLNKTYLSNSKTQIIPIIIGNNEKTIKISKKLFDNNFLGLPIRTPSVPPNTARLRLSLTSNLEFEEIENAFNIILKEKINEI